MIVSPKGHEFYSIGYPRIDNTESPFVICRRSLVDGKVLATGKGKGTNTRVAMDPSGRYVAVSSNMSFYLFDARTLDVLIEDILGNDVRSQKFNNKPYRSYTQPPFFLSSSESGVEVLALRKIWRLSEGKVMQKSTFPDSPEALGPAPQQGFYTMDVGYNEHNLLSYLLWIPSHEAGILLASFDGQQNFVYLMADRRSMFGEIAFLPGRSSSEGYLIVQKLNDICLYDLARHTYRYLLDSNVESFLKFAVSPQNRVVASSDRRTVTVWNIP